MNRIGKTRGRMVLGRAASILLGFILALPCFPVPVHAAGQTAPLSGIRDGDLVYFGTPDDATHFDGAWRVLDSEKTKAKWSLPKKWQRANGSLGWKGNPLMELLWNGTGLVRVGKSKRTAPRLGRCGS